MRNLAGTRVLVTGSASGIGRALARRLAGEGAVLLLVDLNAALLEDAAAELARAGATVRTYVADVTDTAALTALRERVHADGGRSTCSSTTRASSSAALPRRALEKHVATYRINTIGLVTLTHLFLPDLLSRPEAHLVNVASASGFIGLPFGSTYASSKWSVIGFSESIQQELALLGHHHVKVTIVCPSYVSTGLFDGARPPVLTRLLTPDRLADQVVAAIKGDRLWVLTPWLVKVTPILKGLLPTGLFNTVSGALGATSSMTGWKGRGQA